MINILLKKSLKEVAHLISKTIPPVPAGGTTIAINGLLGLSLIKLVLAVSKKDFKKEELHNLAKITPVIKKAEKSFLKAIDEDSKVYQKNLELGFSNEDKLKDIILVPLEIAENGQIVLKITKKIKMKKTVIADYNIAINNLKTVIKGGIDIIKSNYKFFPKESDFIKEIKIKIKVLENNII